MIEERTRYRIVDGVLARTLGESVVLFHPETERLLTITGSGLRIWSLLLEHADRDQIVTRLIDEFDGPPALIREQTLEFLSELEAEQILQSEPRALLPA